MPTGSDSNSTTAAASGVKRVNVEFSTDQYETLQNLARTQNISMSAALRQAISLSKLIVGADADSNTKVLLKTGDNVQELKLIK